MRRVGKRYGAAAVPKYARPPRIGRMNMPDNIFDAPTYQSALGPLPILIICLVLIFAAIAYMTVLAVQNRDSLPAAALISSAICMLGEPLFDVLGQLTYAESPYVAFTSFGREIPWMLLAAYLAMVAVAPYLLARRMATGLSRTQLYWTATGLLLSSAMVEAINAVWWHAWRFYGESPWRGVLAGGLIQIAAWTFVGAFVLYSIDTQFQGWKRLFLGLVAPGVTFVGVFFATSWPMYLANYSDVSSRIAWMAAAVSVVLCVTCVMVIVEFLHRNSSDMGADVTEREWSRV